MGTAPNAWWRHHTAFCRHYLVPSANSPIGYHATHSWRQIKIKLSSPSATSPKTYLSAQPYRSSAKTVTMIFTFSETDMRWNSDALPSSLRLTGYNIGNTNSAIHKVFCRQLERTQRPFQPPASPIHDLRDFQELSRQSHGTVRNREAGGFVNSTVRV